MVWGERNVYRTSGDVEASRGAADSLELCKVRQIFVQVADGCRKTTNNSGFIHSLDLLFNIFVVEFVPTILLENSHPDLNYSLVYTALAEILHHPRCPGSWIEQQMIIVYQRAFLKGIALSLFAVYYR